CNTVRITGGHPDRLEIAASHAADVGLEVWFSPFTNDLTTDKLLDLLADCAQRAEQLRKRGAEVVFVTGAELSLFNKGFLPCDTLNERLGLLTQPMRLREWAAQVPAHMNAFLGKAETLVRECFGGKISYASLPFEGVDWRPFDFVSFGAYRSKEVAVRFRVGFLILVARGTPVALPASACTSARGAPDLRVLASRTFLWGGPT